MTIKLKIIIIVLLVIILTSGLLFIIPNLLPVFFGAQKDEPQEIQIKNIAPGTDGQAAVSTTTAERVAMNVEREKYDKIMADKRYADCSLLSTPLSKDLCWQQAAILSLNISYCDNIAASTTKANCQQFADRQKFEAVKNIADCEKEVTDALKEYCVNTITEKNDVDCDKLKSNNLKRICADNIKLRVTVASRDESQCLKIVDPYIRANCTIMIKGDEAKQDADKDGLAYFEEIMYGTDPNNKDSDKDGYLDGAEVAGGYDPLGYMKPGAIDKNGNLHCNDIQNEIMRFTCSINQKNGIINLRQCNNITDLSLLKFCFDNAYLVYEKK